MSGRPARGIVNRLIREQGPISKEAPAFPLAANAIAPLRAAAEKQGSGDFSPLWSGQAGALGRAMPAGELTRRLAAEALERMKELASYVSFRPSRDAATESIPPRSLSPVIMIGLAGLPAPE